MAVQHATDDETLAWLGTDIGRSYVPGDQQCDGDVDRVLAALLSPRGDGRDRIGFSLLARWIGAGALDGARSERLGGRLAGCFTGGRGAR